MWSLLFIAQILIPYVRGCSPPFPIAGKYYISKVQLLPADKYPDSVLLEIIRTSSTGTWWAPSPQSSFSFVDLTNGPWCKIMNINDGSVSNTVPCSTYSTMIRPWVSPDTDSTSTSVSCADNCDGATATCTINRNSITYTIPNIPYRDSKSPCSTAPTIGGIATSFTISDRSTTYIIFSTNTVGIQFNDNSAAVSGYNIRPPNILNVDREGTGWQYMEPNSPWAMFEQGIERASTYSDVNVIAHTLPCCLCHNWELYTYDIEQDPTGAYDQVLTINSLTFGGYVDAVKQRVIDWGLFYSSSVTVYDLSTGGKKALAPDLCDVTASCMVAPCTYSSCRYYPDARCVDDYCGGCNVRWFCGNSEVTNQCNDASNQFPCAN